MTKADSNNRIPQALEEAIQKKRLLVFAGSGISMLPPSSLPDWWQFNEGLLRGAQNSALESKELDNRGRTAIRALSLEDIGVISQSEAIVKIIAGEMYFPVLKVLDSDKPNANHKALAELASRGIIRVIVTTNFDTLIEQAFHEAKVPLKVAVTPADFTQARDIKACTLYKIHGSVTNTSTLVDTVGQKMRGLTPYARQRLVELFSDLHVLVVGYSGRDLEFGNDYLALAAIQQDGPGITWLERKSDSKRPESVTSLVERVGPRGTFYEADLPDFFGRLGAILVQGTPKESSESEHSAAETAQTAIEAFFKERGNRAALALCMRLLLDSGKIADGSIVRDALVSTVEKLGERLEEQDGPVLRALAVTASLTEGRSRVQHWTLKEIKYLEDKLERLRITSEQVKTKLKEAKAAVSAPLSHGFEVPRSLPDWLEMDRQVVNEIERLQSGAWCNLSINRMEDGDLPGASQAIIRSLNFAELSGSPIELAASYVVYATGLLALRRDIQGGFNWLTFAEAAGLFSGNVDAANAAALKRANMLFAWGEYDAALAILERVRRRRSLGVDRRSEVEVERLAGCIAVRRGKPDEAMTIWQRALEIAGSAVPLNIYVRSAWLSDLAHIPSQLPLIMRECDEIIRMMKDGAIPSKGQVDGIPSLNHIQEWQKFLREHAPLTEPFFLREMPPLQNPDLQKDFDLRTDLLRAEFYGDKLAIVQCLGQLLQHTYQMEAGERALELVQALRIAGHNAGEFSAQVQADWYAGNILYSLGDSQGAVQALRRLDGIIFADDPNINVRVAKKLASINSEPAPRLSTNLMVQRFVNGEQPLPVAPRELESLVEGAVGGGELAPARILCLAAMSSYRLLRDNSSVARCFELLAQMATKENRTPHAEALKRKAKDLGL